jgi:acyl carrier protein
MDTTRQNLIALLADFACVPPESVNFTDNLADIGLDSLDHTQLILELEEHFEIELPESADLTTVAALHDAIQQAQAA